MNAPALVAEHEHLRQRLVTEHVPMARRIARKLCKTSDPTVREEVESSALLGLVEAASRYDFGRETPFTAFACSRIRGAVMDGARRSDLLPRRARSVANRTQRALSMLEQELGRKPDDMEVAERLDVSVEEYQTEIRILTEIRHVELSPELSGPASSSDEGIVECLARRQLVDRMRTAIEGLAPRDRELLTLYYTEERTHSEIARRFGVTEGRISQLHKRALLRLRELLNGTDRD